MKQTWERVLQGVILGIMTLVLVVTVGCVGVVDMGRSTELGYRTLITIDGEEYTGYWVKDNSTYRCWENWNAYTYYGQEGRLGDCIMQIPESRVKMIK